jgi:hypothetical protein
MKAELKRKWIEALRSGKYAQGEGMLKNSETGEMCCLGVLCEIQGTDLDARDGILTYGNNALPKKGEMLGLEKVIVTFRGNNIRANDALVRMNDGKLNDKAVPKFTFPQIADWIEQNVPEE